MISTREKAKPQIASELQAEFGQFKGASPLRWIVAQEGSRQHYGVPLAFQKIGELKRLYTDIWCRWGRGLLACGPAGCRALAGRFHLDIPVDKVVSFGMRAVGSKALRHFLDSRSNPEKLA